MFFTKRGSIQEKRPAGQIPPVKAYGRTVEEPAAAKPPEEEPSAAVVNDAEFTTHISKNTHFTGNIRTSDNFELFGTLTGDINGKAVVKLYGTVSGNVRAGTLVTHGAAVTGEIVCENAAVVGSGSKIKGNLYALSADIAGEVSGNVYAGESAAVKPGGIVYGDLKTPALEVSKGGQIFGKVTMETPNAKAQVYTPPAQSAPEPAKEPPRQPAYTVTTTYSQAAPLPPKTETARTQEILDRLMQQNLAIERASAQAERVVEAQKTERSVWKFK